ncbi:uncharacterized protein LOC113378545 [Ctenocephalides felis]|uniref:uncharacterized protein LOC113378545 n=1 Tax=Ctenocephalides felis TaxID=7515 RepID=UPI000E6E4016|nr:uncharacterized protein LOC113378545 [Ctenocephalides felis]
MDRKARKGRKNSADSQKEKTSKKQSRSKKKEILSDTTDQHEDLKAQLLSSAQKRLFRVIEDSPDSEECPDEPKPRRKYTRKSNLWKLNLKLSPTSTADEGSTSTVEPKTVIAKKGKRLTTASKAKSSKKVTPAFATSSEDEDTTLEPKSSAATSEAKSSKKVTRLTISSESESSDAENSQDTILGPKRSRRIKSSTAMKPKSSKKEKISTTTPEPECLEEENNFSVSEAKGSKKTKSSTKTSEPKSAKKETTVDATSSEEEDSSVITLEPKSSKKTRSSTTTLKPKSAKKERTADATSSEEEDSSVITLEPKSSETRSSKKTKSSITSEPKSAKKETTADATSSEEEVPKSSKKTRSSTATLKPKSSKKETTVDETSSEKGRQFTDSQKEKTSKKQSRSKKKEILSDTTDQHEDLKAQLLSSAQKRLFRVIEDSPDSEECPDEPKPRRKYTRKSNLWKLNLKLSPTSTADEGSTSTVEPKTVIAKKGKRLTTASKAKSSKKVTPAFATSSEDEDTTLEPKPKGSKKTKSSKKVTRLTISSETESSDAEDSQDTILEPKRSRRTKSSTATKPKSSKKEITLEPKSSKKTKSSTTSPEPECLEEENNLSALEAKGSKKTKSSTISEPKSSKKEKTADETSSEEEDNSIITLEPKSSKKTRSSTKTSELKSSKKERTADATSSEDEDSSVITLEPKSSETRSSKKTKSSITSEPKSAKKETTADATSSEEEVPKSSKKTRSSTTLKPKNSKKETVLEAKSSKKTKILTKIPEPEGSEKENISTANSELKRSKKTNSLTTLEPENSEKENNSLTLEPINAKKTKSLTTLEPESSEKENNSLTSEPKSSKKTKISTTTLEPKSSKKVKSLASTSEPKSSTKPKKAPPTRGRKNTKKMTSTKSPEQTETSKPEEAIKPPESADQEICTNQPTPTSPKKPNKSMDSEEEELWQMIQTTPTGTNKSAHSAKRRILQPIQSPVQKSLESAEEELWQLIHSSPGHKSAESAEQEIWKSIPGSPGEEDDDWKSFPNSPGDVNESVESGVKKSEESAEQKRLETVQKSPGSPAEQKIHKSPLSEQKVLEPIPKSPLLRMSIDDSDAISLYTDDEDGILQIDDPQSTSKNKKRGYDTDDSSPDAPKKFAYDFVLKGNDDEDDDEGRFSRFAETKPQFEQHFSTSLNSKQSLDFALDDKLPPEPVPTNPPKNGPKSFNKKTRLSRPARRERVVQRLSLDQLREQVESSRTKKCNIFDAYNNRQGNGLMLTSFEDCNRLIDRPLNVPLHLPPPNLGIKPLPHNMSTPPLEINSMDQNLSVPPPTFARQNRPVPLLALHIPPPLGIKPSAQNLPLRLPRPAFAQNFPLHQDLLSPPGIKSVDPDFSATPPAFAMKSLDQSLPLPSPALGKQAEEPNLPTPLEKQSEEQSLPVCDKSTKPVDLIKNKYNPQVHKLFDQTPQDDTTSQNNLDAKSLAHQSILNNLYGSNYNKWTLVHKISKQHAKPGNKKPYTNHKLNPNQKLNSNQKSEISFGNRPKYVPKPDTKPSRVRPRWMYQDEFGKGFREIEKATSGEDLGKIDQVSGKRRGKRPLNNNTITIDGKQRHRKNKKRACGDSPRSSKTDRNSAKEKKRGSLNLDALGGDSVAGVCIEPGEQESKKNENFKSRSRLESGSDEHIVQDPKQGANCAFGLDLKVSEDTDKAPNTGNDCLKVRQVDDQQDAIKPSDNSSLKPFEEVQGTKITFEQTFEAIEKPTLDDPANPPASDRFSATDCLKTKPLFQNSASPNDDFTPNPIQGAFGLALKLNDNHLSAASAKTQELQSSNKFIQELVVPDYGQNDFPKSINNNNYQVYVSNIKPMEQGQGTSTKRPCEDSEESAKPSSASGRFSANDRLKTIRYSQENDGNKNDNGEPRQNNSGQGNFKPVEQRQSSFRIACEIAPDDNAVTPTSVGRFFANNRQINDQHDSIKVESDSGSPVVAGCSKSKEQESKQTQGTNNAFGVVFKMISGDSADLAKPPNACQEPKQTQGTNNTFRMTSGDSAPKPPNTPRFSANNRLRNRRVSQNTNDQQGSIKVESDSGSPVVAGCSKSMEQESKQTQGANNACKMAPGDFAAKPTNASRFSANDRLKIKPIDNQKVPGANNAFGQVSGTNRNPNNAFGQTSGTNQNRLCGASVDFAQKSGSGRFSVNDRLKIRQVNDQQNSIKVESDSGSPVVAGCSKSMEQDPKQRQDANNALGFKMRRFSQNSVSPVGDSGSPVDVNNKLMEQKPKQLQGTNQNRLCGASVDFANKTGSGRFSVNDRLKIRPIDVPNSVVAGKSMEQEPKQTQSTFGGALKTTSGDSADFAKPTNPGRLKIRRFSTNSVSPAGDKHGSGSPVDVGNNKPMEINQNRLLGASVDFANKTGSGRFSVNDRLKIRQIDDPNPVVAGKPMEQEPKQTQSAFKTTSGDSADFAKPSNTGRFSANNRLKLRRFSQSSVSPVEDQLGSPSDFGNMEQKPKQVQGTNNSSGQDFGINQNRLCGASVDFAQKSGAGRFSVNERLKIRRLSQNSVSPVSEQLGSPVDVNNPMEQKPKQVQGTNNQNRLCGASVDFAQKSEFSVNDLLQTTPISRKSDTPIGNQPDSPVDQGTFNPFEQAFKEIEKRVSGDSGARSSTSGRFSANDRLKTMRFYQNIDASGDNHRESTKPMTNNYQPIEQEPKQKQRPDNAFELALKVNKEPSFPKPTSTSRFSANDHLKISLADSNKPIEQDSKPGQAFGINQIIVDNAKPTSSSRISDNDRLKIRSEHDSIESASLQETKQVQGTKLMTNICSQPMEQGPKQTQTNAFGLGFKTNTKPVSGDTVDNGKPTILKIRPVGNQNNSINLASEQEPKQVQDVINQNRLCGASVDFAQKSGFSAKTTPFSQKSDKPINNLQSPVDVDNFKPTKQDSSNNFTSSKDTSVNVNENLNRLCGASIDFANKSTPTSNRVKIRFSQTDNLRDSIKPINNCNTIIDVDNFKPTENEKRLFGACVDFAGPSKTGPSRFSVNDRLRNKNFGNKIEAPGDGSKLMINNCSKEQKSEQVQSANEKRLVGVSVDFPTRPGRFSANDRLKNIRAGQALNAQNVPIKPAGNNCNPIDISASKQVQEANSAFEQAFKVNENRSEQAFKVNENRLCGASVDFAKKATTTGQFSVKNRPKTPISFNQNSEAPAKEKKQGFTSTSLQNQKRLLGACVDFVQPPRLSQFSDRLGPRNNNSQMDSGDPKQSPRLGDHLRPKYFTTVRNNSSQMDIGDPRPKSFTTNSSQMDSGDPKQSPRLNDHLTPKFFTTNSSQMNVGDPKQSPRLDDHLRPKNFTTNSSQMNVGDPKQSPRLDDHLRPKNFTTNSSQMNVGDPKQSPRLNDHLRPKSFTTNSSQMDIGDPRPKSFTTNSSQMNVGDPKQSPRLNDHLRPKSFTTNSSQMNIGDPKPVVQDKNFTSTLYQNNKRALGAPVGRFSANDRLTKIRFGQNSDNQQHSIDNQIDLKPIVVKTEQGANIGFKNVSDLPLSYPPKNLGKPQVVASSQAGQVFDVEMEDVFEPVDVSKSVQAEAMEWEPISEVVVMETITCIRKDSSILKTPSVQPCQNKLISDRLHVVVDTNIFLVHLHFVQYDLLHLNYENLHQPVVVVPWIVLQELDCIKDRKGENQQLQNLARRAINYLNKSFMEQSPKIHGQSAVDCSNHLITIDCPDDKILNCCLQIQKTNKNVVLLSNDNNLRTKCIVTRVQAFCKDDLLASLVKMYKDVDVGDVRVVRSGQDPRKYESSGISRAPNKIVSVDGDVERVKEKVVVAVQAFVTYSLFLADMQRARNEDRVAIDPKSPALEALPKLTELLRKFLEAIKNVTLEPFYFVTLPSLRNFANIIQIILKENNTACEDIDIGVLGNYCRTERKQILDIEQRLTSVMSTLQTARAMLLLT